MSKKLAPVHTSGVKLLTSAQEQKYILHGSAVRLTLCPMTSASGK